MSIEWCLFNAQGGEIQHEELHTDARYAFISVLNDAIDAYIFVDATFLDWDRQEIFRHQERKTVHRQ
jgi:hypothetical protein